jgi:hypothetical protein
MGIARYPHPARSTSARESVHIAGILNGCIAPNVTNMHIMHQMENGIAHDAG